MDRGVLFYNFQKTRSMNMRETSFSRLIKTRKDGMRRRILPLVKVANRLTHEQASSRRRHRRLVYSPPGIIHNEYPTIFF